MRRGLHALVVVLVGALLLAPASARAEGPLVLAAASLQDVMAALADDWAAGGAERPVLSFAGTQAIARQAAAGAPADIFISADRQWMDYLQKGGHLQADSRHIVARNRLVIVAGEEGPWLGDPAAFLNAVAGRPLAVADTESVPAGRYAKAALTKMGVWNRLEGDLARTENVRAALALVERGAAPYGIVYQTDARASKAVRIAGRFAPEAHAPIVYPAALLKTASHEDAARFLDFLTSPRAQAIFRRYGFAPAANGR